MSQPDEPPRRLVGEAALEFLARLSAEHRAASAAALLVAKAEAARAGKPPPDVARLREAFADAPLGVLQWVPHGIWDDPEAVAEWAEPFYYHNRELRDTDDMIDYLCALEAGRDWEPRPRPGTGT